MQVGDDAHNVNIIVSTIAEAEHMADYLLESQTQGKSINVSPAKQFTSAVPI